MATLGSPVSTIPMKAGPAASLVGQVLERADEVVVVR